MANDLRVYDSGTPKDPERVFNYIDTAIDRYGMQNVREVWVMVEGRAEKCWSITLSGTNNIDVGANTAYNQYGYYLGDYGSIDTRSIASDSDQVIDRLYYNQPDNKTYLKVSGSAFSPAEEVTIALYGDSDHSFVLDSSLESSISGDVFGLRSNLVNSVELTVGVVRVAGSWSALPTGLNSGGSGSENLLSVGHNGGSVYIAGSESGYCSRSTDYGVTWSAITRGLNNLGSDDLPVNAFCGSGTTWLAGFSDGYASRSTDGGTTWTGLARGLNCGSSSVSIQDFTCLGSTFIAVFSQGYASRSTDGGATWTGLPQGLSSGSVFYNNALSLASGGGNKCFAGFDSAYASRSTDSGATWTAMPRTLNSGASTSDAVTALATSYGSTIIAGFTGGYASISTDSGVTWSPLPRGLNSGTTTSSVLSLAVSGSTVVAGFASGYASMSTDDGATWTALPRGLNSGHTSKDINSIAGNSGKFVAVMSSGYASRYS